jgi:hypothetical protein
MNLLYIFILKALRKVYVIFFKTKVNNVVCEKDSEKSFSLIYNALSNDNPCMIARFGSTELACLSNYLGVKNPDKNIFIFVKFNI